VYHWPSSEDEHTDVDRRLVLAGFASFVLRSKRSPVERTVHRPITKGVYLNGLCALCALELGQAVKACCGCGRSKEECGEEHDE
jgi:hypothetical protein